MAHIRLGKFIIIFLLLLTCSAIDQQRMIIVVPQNLATTANLAAKRWHTNFWGVPRGTNAVVWDVPLTTNQYGTGNVTHYWCNWQFTSNEWWWFTNKLAIASTANIKLFNAATTTPDQVLIDLNLKRYETNGP